MRSLIDIIFDAETFQTFDQSAGLPWYHLILISTRHRRVSRRAVSGQRQPQCALPSGSTPFERALRGKICPGLPKLTCFVDDLTALDCKALSLADMPVVV